MRICHSPTNSYNAHTHTLSRSHDTKPSYFIFGGFVFTRLTNFYLRSTYGASLSLFVCLYLSLEAHCLSFYCFSFSPIDGCQPHFQGSRLLQHISHTILQHISHTTGMDWTHKAPIKLCDRSFSGVVEAEGQEVCVCCVRAGGVCVCSVCVCEIMIMCACF